MEAKRGLQFSPEQAQRLRVVIAQLTQILAEDDRRRSAMGLKADEDFGGMTLDVKLREERA